MPIVLIISPAHSLPLHFAAPPLPPADAELCDSSPGCGGVQHFSDAEEPREEPQHGRPAAGPLPGLPGHHRRREQQLHQRRARRQLPPARCLCGDAAPAARHHHWLLEARVRLWLHLGGDAQPAQPVQLCLGKKTGTVYQLEIKLSTHVVEVEVTLLLISLGWALISTLSALLVLRSLMFPNR